MSSQSSHAPSSSRAPGDGADRPDNTHRNRRYVYVARSRRAGGLSLGIDLTPDGYCSFSCVYCQATHPLVREADRTLDVARMREDLVFRLREDKGELKDVVLAGSGEPTSVPNLGDALQAIQDECEAHRPQLPVKLFTNGRHLGQRSVGEAVGRFAERSGQVWVKLDGVQDETIRKVNGRSFDVESHLSALWDFASEHKIGIQTMLLRGPDLGDPGQIVDEVAMAIRAGLARGAMVSEVHLLTLSRRPSDERAAQVLESVPLRELEMFAGLVRGVTGLEVAVFPA